MSLVPRREFAKGLLDLLKELGEEYLEHVKIENSEEYERHIEALEKLDERGKFEYLVRLGQVKGRNILLLINEAHRTQYSILAVMRKTVFPQCYSLRIHWNARVQA